MGAGEGIELLRNLCMFKEFKEFALKGNVVDMAVGIIIGAAFGAIVNSLVSDVIMPPIGALLGNLDFSNAFWVLREGSAASAPYATLGDAQAAGAVTLNYGLFINKVISFLVVAFAIFFMIRGMNRLRRTTEKETPPPSVKECPECCSEIPLRAKRCPQCASSLNVDN